MDLASIIIDSDISSTEARSVDLTANIGKQIATFGRNGISRGAVKPERDKGRITIFKSGIYRCFLGMSFQSMQDNMRVIVHIAKNGINTHIKFEDNIWFALGALGGSCSDYLELNRDDTISVNILSALSGTVTVDNAQLIVKKET